MIKATGSTESGLGGALWQLLYDYGMLAVLLLLCLFFSAITYSEQHPVGPTAGEQLGRLLVESGSGEVGVLVVAGKSQEEAAFAGSLEEVLRPSRAQVLQVVQGEPRDVRLAFEGIHASGKRLDVIACTDTASKWVATVLAAQVEQRPALASAEIRTPQSYMWPDFLKLDNLLNIANQIAVIAIIAIGMTMVIITAGIDLSVGSLIALSAVTAAWLIRAFGGAEDAGAIAMVACSLTAVAFCGAIGLFSGVMVALCRIPPFIVTLSMMLVASGLAYLISEGQSIHQVPKTFNWLGGGADLGVPNTVVLMLVLYVIAHVLMTRTVLGRYIYAVGGNPEAARLSGVPVRRVLLFVYTACGALAGIGGIVTASLFTSGSPKYGETYELDVIAAVVVGGTSLLGGEGKVLGTLIGALITGVIRNGMNLTGVESYTQKVVLGLVILAAVLADRLKAWVVQR